MSTVVGWDVGGANIKAARLGPGTNEVSVGVERPFALWREPHLLADVLRDVAQETGRASVMAVTMTAELADCFASKSGGVDAVVAAFESAFPEAELRVFGTDGIFRSPAEARREPYRVASANWAATARLVAREHPDVLLLDVGSTTTDLIPIVAGRVAAAGTTDPERLRTGELVYTGALRTPICAVLPRVRLRDGWYRVAAERFAVAADAHLWLGNIPPERYSCDTADGRGIHPSETAARLARVVCADPPMLDSGDIDRIARQVHHAQRRQIATAVRQLRERLDPRAPQRALAVGSGRFLAIDACRIVGIEVVQSAQVLHPVATAAAAVAYLLRDELQAP